MMMMGKRACVSGLSEAGEEAAQGWEGRWPRTSWMDGQPWLSLTS